VPDPNLSNNPDNVNKVYVAGLSFDATEADVRDFFSDCGDITLFRLPSHAQGKHKGFCFLEFATGAGAAAAVAKDGQTMMNRWLKVTMSTGSIPVRDAGPLNVPPSLKPAGCKIVFVANLSFHATEDDLRALFEPCGEVWSVVCECVCVRERERYRDRERQRQRQTERVR
jgi:RNA recognition motif-containing protein